MAMYEALVARLLANAAIASAIDDSASIAWGERPRDKTNSVRLTPVWPGVEWRLSDLDALERPRVQFDAFGATKTACLTLSRAIRAEMERYDDFTIGGWVFCPPGMIEAEGFDVPEVGGTDGLFRHFQDFSFFHHPA